MFKKSHLILIGLIFLLVLTACERSATSASVDEATATLPFPTPGENGGTQDPIGTLLAWGYATQTQMAAEAEGLDDARKRLLLDLLGKMQIDREGGGFMCWWPCSQSGKATPSISCRSRR